MYSLYSKTIGNVYIADSKNHRIRKVTVSTGIITTIAGTGTSSLSGDNGQATSASLSEPNGVALDLLGGELALTLSSTFVLLLFSFKATFLLLIQLITVSAG
jgi:hypothetical protein